MIIKTDDYRIEMVKTDASVISGKMRLPSPSAYIPQFEGIQKAITSVEGTYTIDIRDLEYLNSSGINALARLVFHARTIKKPLIIECTADVPWQKKTVASLKGLWDQLEIRLS